MGWTGSVVMWAVVLMLLVGGARADVRYVDVPDVPITYDGWVISYAGGEVFFQRNAVIYADRTVDRTNAFPSYGDSAVAAQTKGEPWAVALALGEPVAAHLPWVTTSGVFIQTTCPKATPDACGTEGPWLAAERYLALRFRQLGNTYYGWARFAHEGSASGPYAPMVLRDYAIENTVNLPVLAGARESLPVLVRRALKAAAGMESLEEADAALLDRAGVSGCVDVPDVVALLKVMAG